MKLLQILFIALSLIQISQAADCQALIISGGSDYGAYSAGAISKLLQKSKTHYDVYSGIGPGALTASVLNQYDNSEKNQQINALNTFWQELKKDKFYETWIQGGVGYGMVNEPGLFNYENLQKHIEKYITLKQNSKISVASTNIDTGNLVRYTEKLSQEDFVQGLMASNSNAGFFPWRQFQENNVFSGTVSSTLDLMGAWERCSEITSSEYNMVFDIVLLFSHNVTTSWGGGASQKTFQIYRRDEILRSAQRVSHELVDFFDNHPEIVCRYLVEPVDNLPDAKLPYYFEDDDIKKQYQQGQADAEQVIQEGNGIMCEKAIKRSTVKIIRDSDSEFYKNLSDDQILTLANE